MLPRGHRLTTASDFSRVVKSGRRSGGPLVVVHLAIDDAASDDSPADPAPRVGFVVSKSVGNAVVRNRVKRRIRHCVRGLLPELPAGTRLVVRAQPEAANASSAELSEALARCLERVQRKEKVR